MKNKQTNVLKRRSLLAIIALVAVIGFSMTACDLFEKEEEETFSLQGKWKSSSRELTISGDNFTLIFTGVGITRSGRGTYTATSTHITFSPTQSYDYIWDSSENNYVWRWVDFDPSNDGHTLMFRGVSVGYIFDKPTPYKIEKSDNRILLTLMDSFFYKE